MALGDPVFECDVCSAIRAEADKKLEVMKRQRDEALAEVARLVEGLERILGGLAGPAE